MIWAVALSAGIVALLLLGKHPQLIDAGPVYQAHSVLGEDCSSCHSNHEKGMLHWLVSATSPATTLADNGQCLSCHEGTGHSENAHGESPQWLSEAYEPLENTDASKPWQLRLLREVGFSENSDDPLSCATCHQEHRGPHHELAEMDNLKCQGCHQIQFRDFEHGHPEFKNYPPTGTASISFDHRTHFGKHFTSGDLPSEAPTNCNSCHQLEDSGENIVNTGFVRACDGCHEPQTRGQGLASDKGIPMFRLPGIDIETLENAGKSIGEWPFDADEKSTKVLHWILAANPEVAKLLPIIKPLDLLDLSGVSQDELKTVAEYALSIKKLLHSIDTQGHTVFREYNVPAATLPTEVVSQALNEWFPNLDEEVSRLEMGLELASTASGAAFTPTDPPEALQPTNSLVTGAELLDEGGLLGDDDGVLLGDDDGGSFGDTDAKDDLVAKHTRSDTETWVNQGGWYRKNFTLYYRPTGHADRVIQDLLDSASQSNIPGSELVFEKISDEKSPGRCGKCHTVDNVNLEIHWLGSAKDQAMVGSTLFSHKPHVTRAECSDCHKRGALPDGADNNFTLASDHLSLDKTSCTSCHGEKSLGSNCVDCHRYHFSPFETKAIFTQVSNPVEPVD